MATNGVADASHVNTDKYRKRRVTAPYNPNGKMPTAAIAAKPLNHNGGKNAAVQELTEQKFSECTGALYITTAAYLVDCFREADQQRIAALNKFVAKYQHLLPVQDQSAGVEGKAFTLLWILGYTDDPKQYAPEKSSSTGSSCRSNHHVVGSNGNSASSSSSSSSSRRSV